MIELNARPISAVAVYEIDSLDELADPVWDGLCTIYGLELTR